MMRKTKRAIFSKGAKSLVFQKNIKKPPAADYGTGGLKTSISNES